jgi:uncharacterized membrane protein
VRTAELEAGGVSSSSASSSSASSSASSVSYGNPTKLSVLRAVGRRLVPHLVEATIVPTLLFYLSFVTFGAVAAYVSALAWSTWAIGRRVVRGAPVPAILLLAGIGLAVRTLFALASGSTFVYFMQPVLGKFALSGVFLLSVAQGRPLIGRFARDFCTMPADIEARAGIVRLYRHLTYLWAGVNLAAAAVSLLLLLTLPVTAFLAIKPFVGWLITSAGIALTVSASVHVARRECLLAAISPNGALSARCRLNG